MKSIQLLNLTSEQNSTGLDDRWQLPLNHLWLGTYLQFNGYDVEVLDTNIDPLQELLARITAPVLAVSFLATSAHLLGKVTAIAKQRGCFVVVGGQAATPLASQILQNDDNVDVVVSGDGEEALLGIARFVIDKIGSLDEISNLAFRHVNKIVFTQNQLLDLSTLPVPDRRLSGIDIEKYVSNFLPTNTDRWNENLRATNAYVKKGCPRRVGTSGCSFCSRIDQGLRSKSALQAYQEYKYLVDEFNINYIYDDSDSWIERAWLRELVDLYAKHGEINTRFRVYGDLKDINKETLKLMEVLGVDAVLVGIESGDEWVSRINGKPVIRKHVLDAAKLLGNAGIKLWDAYVLGLFGETVASVEKTRALAADIRNYCDKANTYWSLIQPLPGSRVWAEMMKVPEFRVLYGKNHVFDLERVRKAFVDNYCDLGANGYEYLVGAAKAFQISEGLPWKNYVR